MNRHPDAPDTLIIVAAEHASFYDHLKKAQESARTRIILERRQRPRAAPPPPEIERRAPAPASAGALMAVLGFMVLHRQGGGWTP